MALQKTIIFRDGSEASYWRIQSRFYHDDSHRLEIVLRGYRDETWRRTEDSEPVKHEDARKQIEIYGDEYNSDMTRADIYELLKTMEGWADADNC